MIANLQLTPDDKNGYRLVVNDHDLSSIAERVEMYLEAGRMAMVNVWIPANAAIDIPADLVIFVDYPDAAEDTVVSE